jgi:hypothetical protein
MTATGHRQPATSTKTNSRNAVAAMVAPDATKGRFWWNCCRCGRRIAARLVRENVNLGYYRFSRRFAALNAPELDDD